MDQPCGSKPDKIDGMCRFEQATFGGTPIDQRTDVFELRDDVQVLDVTGMTLPMEAGRFRTLVRGPDGSLAVATDGSEIVRMTSPGEHASRRFGGAPAGRALIGGVPVPCRDSLAP